MIASRRHARLTYHGGIERYGGRQRILRPIDLTCLYSVLRWCCSENYVDQDMIEPAAQEPDPISLLLGTCPSGFDRLIFIDLRQRK